MKKKNGLFIGLSVAIGASVLSIALVLSPLTKGSLGLDGATPAETPYSIIFDNTQNRLSEGE